MGVVAPMEISPFMIMWDPRSYPQFNAIADIGKTDAKVFYFEGDTYSSSARGPGLQAGGVSRGVGAVVTPMG
jgi:hypothetical protein